MDRMTAKEIAAAVNGTIVAGPENATIDRVTTDSREVQPGVLFIGVRGESFDGSTFAPQAIAAGAAGVIVSFWATKSPGSAFVIVVANTTRALGLLAKSQRERRALRVVGITGSVGKTTTKEMLASILNGHVKHLTAPKNWNNEFGLPQTLLLLEPDHEVAVVELAMRGMGEIRLLAKIAQPQIGVITNIGLSHVERTGSVQATAVAKAELLELLPSDGIAILP